MAATNASNYCNGRFLPLGQPVVADQIQNYTSLIPGQYPAEEPNYEKISRPLQPAVPDISCGSKLPAIPDTPHGFKLPQLRVPVRLIVLMVGAVCLIFFVILLTISGLILHQQSNAICSSCINSTESHQILMTTKGSARKLINIANTLSNLQSTSTSTAGVVDTILLVVQDLLELHNNSSSSPTALHSSCKEIKEQLPNSPSGFYLLKTAATINSEGFPYKAYCNMEELCGSGGGWTRLAYLDMTDSTENCPSGFKLYQSGGVKGCGRATSSGGSCTSVQFPSNGISYSQVCGRVTGYQYGSTDAHSNYYGVGSWKLC